MNLVHPSYFTAGQSEAADGGRRGQGATASSGGSQDLYVLALTLVVFSLKTERSVPCP